MQPIQSSGTIPQCHLIRVMLDRSAGQDLLKLTAFTKFGESSLWIPAGGDICEVLGEIEVCPVGKQQLSISQAMDIDCRVPMDNFARARALFCVHPDMDRAGAQYIDQVAKHVAIMAEKYDVSWKVQKYLVTVTGRLTIRCMMLVPKRSGRRRLLCYADGNSTTGFSSLDLLTPVPADFDGRQMFFEVDGETITAEGVAKHLVRSAI